MNTYDVLVIGAGPGGYVAAIRCHQLGLKVAVVEKEHLGGVCLNWGCIPTKALLKSADVLRTVSKAKDFGIEASIDKIDLQKMVERSRLISSQLAKGIGGLFKKNKIENIQGEAFFKNSQTITVKNNEKSTDYTAKKIIIATGARSRELPHLKADGERIWLARHAMTPKFLPKKLLVIGSGAIGMEFASFYQTLGTQVKVVELCDRILPQEDQEVSAAAQKSFEKQGIQFVLNASVDSLKNKGKSVEAMIKKTSSQTENEEFDAAIIAIGIIGNTENLCLEKTKVKADKNQIIVNEYLQTNDEHIYAIGDVAGAPWLAHKASHEGILAAEHIAGKNVMPLHKKNIPGCTYTHPQVASVGLTEIQAKEQYKTIKVGRFPFQANGKALTLGEAEGFVKTIFHEQTGELLGVHMIGEEVTELIHSFVLAKNLETTEKELMHTVFPHPTLSEMLHESVLNAFDQAIHI